MDAVKIVKKCLMRCKFSANRKVFKSKRKKVFTCLDREQDEYQYEIRSRTDLMIISWFH